MSTRPMNSLRFKDRLIVYEALKLVCSSVEGMEGMCAYEPGHTDETVAKSLEAQLPTITVSNVLGLRKEMFGNLYMRSPTGTGRWEARKQIQDHEERLQLVEAEVDRLCKLLASKPIRSNGQ